jgi:hypothetical protein
MVRREEIEIEIESVRSHVQERKKHRDKEINLACDVLCWIVMRTDDGQAWLG